MSRSRYIRIPVAMAQSPEEKRAEMSNVDQVARSLLIGSASDHRSLTPTTTPFH